MADRLRHLLLVTKEDPFDPTSWSGIPFSLRAALERHVERVTVLRSGRPKVTPFALLKRLLFGWQKYPLWITRPTLQNAAREVRAEIKRVRPDAVLSISSQCVAYLQREAVPI